MGGRKTPAAAGPEGQLLTGLAKVGLALKSHAWRTAGPLGISPTQGQILALLRAAPAPLRLGRIAEGLGVTAPTASDAVRVLVEKGLVVRQAVPGDGRAVAIALTRDGRSVGAEAAEGPDALLSAAGALDATEQGVLLKALTAMIATMQQDGTIAPARMCVGCRYFRPNVHRGPRPHHCDFVDARFGDRELRLECGEQEAAEPVIATVQLGRLRQGVR